MIPCEHSCALSLGDHCPGRQVPDRCTKVAENQPGRADWMRAQAAKSAIANEKPKPSYAQRAASYLAAKAIHLATGKREVDDSTFERRTTICESNVCGEFRASDRSCAKCGCPVAKRGPDGRLVTTDEKTGQKIEIKARWASQRCPLNPPLWDRVMIEKETS